MRSFLIVLVYSLVVVALHLLSYLNPGPSDWGLHHYSFLSSTWIIVGAGAGVLVFLFSWMTRPGRQGIQVPLMVAAPLAVIGGGVLFWLARAQGHFLGDGPARIESLIQGRFIWQIEPGGILIPYQLQKLLGHSDPAMTLAVLSVASGVIFLALSAWFAREVAGDAWGRGLVFGLLALAGVTRLFYGFVDTYPLLAAMAMLYLVITVRYLRGHGPGWLLGLTGTLVFMVHSSGLLLLPSMVYALWVGRKDSPGSSGRRLLVLGIPLTVLVGSEIYLKTIGLGLGDIFSYYRDNLLPLRDASGVAVQYPVFSMGHLFDFLQQEILVGPFAALFAILLLVLGAKWRLGPEGRFLFFAGIPWWVFSFLFNHQIGASRQWCYFAPAIIPFLLLVGLALVRIPWRRDRPLLSGALAGLLIGVSLFHTLPWVGIGMNADRSLAHFVGLYAPGTEASPFARSYAFDQVGTHYVSLREMDNAQMAYKEAVNADTTNGYAAGHLGSVLLSNGETRRAANFLKWAGEKDSDSEFLHYELGNAYLQLGIADSAAFAFRRAIDLNGDFRQAYINLAVVERRLGNLESAESVLEDAERRYPQDSQIASNFARLKHERGDSLGAVSKYREALEYDSENTNAAYNLAGLLMSMKRLDEAIPYFEMVVNRKPLDAEAWINLGVAQELQGNHDPAMIAYQQAMLIEPNRPEPYFNIFRSYIDHGDTTTAITVLQAYAARDTVTRYGVMARQLLDDLGAD